MRILVLLFTLAVASYGQIEKTLESLTGVRHYPEAAISPDGKRLAWLESVHKVRAGEPVETLLIGGVDRSSPSRLVKVGDGGCQLAGLSWSPDSRQLVFVASCGTAHDRQVYLADAASGDARKLTHLVGYLQNPRWSPDGAKLAVLFTENAIRVAGPTQPTAPDAGVVEEKFYEQRLTLIDPVTGQAHPLSPADTYVYEYDWSPDGKRFVYSAAKGSGDNNWWVARLFTLDVDGGTVHPLFTPATQVAVPRWSPDGGSIAFIQGLMSDEGSTGGDIYLIPAAGGTAKDLTPDRKASAAWIGWQPGAHQLLASERVDGGIALTQFDIATGAAERLWQADESISGGGSDSAPSLANDGKTSALVRTSWERAPEIWTGRINDWQPRTDGNAAARREWGEAKKLHWQSDGATVQGWLVYPKNYDPAKRYPLVVSIHGGPASARSPSWPSASLDYTLLSAEGYFILFPNPRGSYGSGEAFTAANVKDFGYGDLRDVNAGVDEVVKTLPVDENRLGVGGWSYGGFMTMWTVTQTHRYRAAVAGAGISNWQSYYGENSIDEWMIPYFGASVYDDSAVYAKSSPMTYIKNVRTPTLIMVGDRDAECPSPQSYEFWHALKTEGVKTEFVIYPGEGHHFNNPKNVEDLVKRTVAWYNENLK